MNTYAFAHNLVGFKSSTLRVIVTEVRQGHAWVRTADLLDAGTPLVLNESQIEYEKPETVISHKSGLVSFA